MTNLYFYKTESWYWATTEVDFIEEIDIIKTITTTENKIQDILENWEFWEFNF